MVTALRWADELGPSSPLPLSLEEVSQRAKLVNEINRVDFVDTLFADRDGSVDIKQKGKELSKLSRRSKKYMPDVKSPELRKNISLRLWSGCLAAAKTVALGTRAGPNTPEIRALATQNMIDPQSQTDPIFRAGVEAGICFKRFLKEPFSLEGIPDGSSIRRMP